MKNKDEKLVRFISISESHQAFGLPKPQHPLISLVHFDDSNPFNTDMAPIYDVLNFYKITFITQNRGRLKYGRDYYDFNEGSMLFLAPHQLVGSTDYNSKTHAYILLIHPDFLMGHPLAQKIKQYGYFAYSVNVGFRFAYFFRQRTQSFHNVGVWRPLDASFLQRWQQPGDEKRTHVPSFEYPSNSFRHSFFNGVEANVLPGDVIRLNDIRLTYQMRRWRGLRNVELFGLLSNVGILWRANRQGWDPATPGNELGLPRSASFGLSIGL